jgi:alpha-beta hydrolase superfamily lysophospholipase
MLAASELVKAQAARLPLPSLVMIGTADALADPETTRRFVTAAPHERVELVAWDGLYHELLNEPEKEQVFARVLEWLESRLART